MQVTPLECIKETDEAGAGSVKDYFLLLKPRVMSLVIFTGWVGILLAPNHFSPFLSMVALLCIAIGAGASGALNMWYEHDIDALMKRTQNRPLPKGRISRENALAFGSVLALFSTYLLGLATNILAGFLLAFTIFFYVVVYTIWLKRVTPYNIVIGGLAGALPPLIGWVAVTGALHAFPLILTLIIFMWTPPHFWALALNHSKDYERAKIPMLPLVKGREETKKQIMLYALSLLPLVLSLPALGYTSFSYGVFTSLLSGYFFILSFSLWWKETAEKARRLFKFSLLYLFLVFFGLIMDHFFQGF